MAIAKADSYDPGLVKRQVQALFDNLGGLKDVVRPGARVAIKTNMTGGANSMPSRNFPGTETYITHPEVLRAVGELLRDAGAGQLYLVEAIWNPADLTVWGGGQVAQSLNAQIVDLNNPMPYPDFARMSVGANPYIYPEFNLNRVLQEIDVFVSVAKMKCHACCGVTLAMKNLIGITPMNLYQRPGETASRSALHGAPEETGMRLPRVVVDLNRARPIHLAVIDGIKTAEGGEGPWHPTMHQVTPGVLLAGKNALATDAVAAAVMGFNPQADYPTAPFLHGANHLNLARVKSLGTNDLRAIQVVGATIDQVRYPFQPGGEC